MELCTLHPSSTCRRPSSARVPPLPTDAPPVCTVASRHHYTCHYTHHYMRRPELYQQLLDSAKRARGMALNGHKTVETCQSYLLLGMYHPPLRTFREDGTSLPRAHDQVSADNLNTFVNSVLSTVFSTMVTLRQHRSAALGRISAPQTNGGQGWSKFTQQGPVAQQARIRWLGQRLAGIHGVWGHTQYGQSMQEHVP